MGVITIPNKVGAVVSGIYSDRSHTLLPFGDSLTAPMWRQHSLTGSITVSDGVATFTLTGAHNAPVGTRFRLALASFAGYNTIHTITATGSSTTVSFAAPSGAPASETVVSQIAYMENDQNFSLNYVHALQAYAKYRFYIPWNGGVGGDDSTEALARVGEAVAACQTYNVGRALVMIGTNDALNTVTVDPTATMANIRSICSAFLNIGVAVDLCTIPPFGSGYADVSSTTKVPFMLELNRLIRKHAQQTNGIRLHDVYSWVTDPAQANGQAKANAMGTDGIHFNAVSATAASSGAWLIAKQMALNYVSWLGNPVINLPASQADCTTFNSACNNKFNNAIFGVTSGGTASTNTTGTVASQWTAYHSVASQVASVEARTVANDGDTLGNNQKLVMSLAAGGTGLLYQDPSARMTAGKTYIARAAVTVVLSTMTYVAAEISIGFTVGGFARTVRSGLSPVPENGNYVIETAPFIYPAGATSPLFYLRWTESGAGSPEIEWGRADLYEVD
jgi:lysophospholipase L1-like esterase